MEFLSVNYWAILVAAASSMATGFIWYGPLLGKQWMKLAGITKSDIDKAKKKGMTASYLLGFVGAFVTAFVLAHVIRYVGATTAATGIQTGLWMWLGFVATTSLSGFLWEGKPWALWVLNNGYNIVNLGIIGAIVAVWM